MAAATGITVMTRFSVCAALSTPAVASEITHAVRSGSNTVAPG
jgi:hypothetical protein